MVRDLLLEVWSLVEKKMFQMLLKFKAMCSDTEDICRHTEKDIACLTICKSSLLGQTRPQKIAYNL